MTNRIQNQALALAGLFQASTLVDRMAHTGMVDSSQMEASLYSVFQLDPPSVAAVYNGISGVRNGLRLLDEVLQASAGDTHGRAIRYTINLLHLESRLRQDPAMLNDVRTRLQAMLPMVAERSPIDDEVVAGLDEIYRETLSTLSFRIQVAGEANQLQNESVARRVRALLLAGVRSAMLWRQMGGSRWHLLLRRGKLQRACRDLLEA